MSGAFLRRRDRTARPLPVEHYSAAVNMLLVATTRSLNEADRGWPPTGDAGSDFHHCRDGLSDSLGGFLDVAITQMSVPQRHAGVGMTEQAGDRPGGTALHQGPLRGGRNETPVSLEALPVQYRTSAEDRLDVGMRPAERVFGIDQFGHDPGKLWLVRQVGYINGMTYGRPMMRLPSRCLVAGLTATLIACGGQSTLPVAETPEIPLQTAVLAPQAPVVDLDRRLHVGADVASLAEDLPIVAVHGDTSISHGTIRDGVGAAEVIAYLRADAVSYAAPDNGDGSDVQLLPEGLVFRFAGTPPTVRVAEGTPAALIDETVRVVQAINAALPRAWQLRFGPDPAVAPAPADGEILVTFAPQASWPAEAVPPDDGDIGLAEPRYAIAPTGDPEIPWSIEIVAGRVWVDPSQTEGVERLGVIAHELIHLLGRGHVDPQRFPQTLMVAGGSEELSQHILHPLDREALHAVYGRLAAGTTPDRIAEELGPWSDASMHVRGVLETGDREIAFGAALRNGLAQPWALGPTPDTDLEDNAALSGSALWTGRLLGLTPHAETVAGAVEMTVDLPSLAGSLNLTGLEYWSANTAPATAGSGATWSDGRLSYRVAVRGNTFVQTGGDEGTVTGAFFGPSHEGMGGVLVRDDLSAGFGGKR